MKKKKAFLKEHRGREETRRGGATANVKSLFTPTAAVTAAFSYSISDLSENTQEKHFEHD